MPRVICDHCAEVIGVYEPMVVVTQGQARETSRAAEQVATQAGELYHLTCYEQAEQRAAAGATARRPH